MNLSLIKLILSFFDYFNKKKIILFFKKKFDNKIPLFIDVGAHHGETIKVFNKNFNIENFLAFEASPKNYQKLLKKTKNINNLRTYNIGLGEKKTESEFKEYFETESSTIVKINEESNYYKRKNLYLDFLNREKNKYENIKIKIDRLDNILDTLKIKKIDILKIDTEGYDFQVMRGSGEFIKNVNYIYFEHHFHNMLIKNYTLSDIHKFMEKNNFKKIFKIKMYFRKTFEYIYCNKSFIK